METRYAISKTHEDVLDMIPRVCEDFYKTFGRNSAGLVEKYKTKDADKIIVAMGSVVGTIKEVVDQMRSKGKKVGALKIITYRPFPYREVWDALKNAKAVAVVEKAISLGAFGPLYCDVLTAFLGKARMPKTSGFIIGLGGRDITRESIQNIFKRLSGKQVNAEFIDLKEELLEEKYG